MAERAPRVDRWAARTARALEARTSGTTLNVYVDGGLVLGPVAIPAAPLNATYAGMYAETKGGSSTWATFNSLSVQLGP